jgi:hypothetical protein
MTALHDVHPDDRPSASDVSEPVVVDDLDAWGAEYAAAPARQTHNDGEKQR